SNDVEVANSEFVNFWRGMTFSHSNNIKIYNNEIHEISADGIDVAQCGYVDIADNYIHDLKKSESSGEHQDMIQFWTSGTTEASHDVTIRNNILHTGDGLETQSIFMRNELQDQGLVYKNFTIENNLIVNAHLHGITIGLVDGVEINNNTLLHNYYITPDLGRAPQINVDPESLNVHVSNNVLPVQGGVLPTDALVENNVVLQFSDPSKSNYYGNVFNGGTPTEGFALEGLQIVPTSAYYGYGAASTTFEAAETDYSGFIAHRTGEGLQSLDLDFDASEIFQAAAKLDLADAQVSWTFGDGATASGVLVSHQFAGQGAYDVAATVTLAGGDVVRLAKTVAVESPIVLRISTDKGVVGDDSAFAHLFDASSATVVDRDEGGAFRLNGKALAFVADQRQVGNEEFTIGFDFKADDVLGKNHQILSIPGSFVIAVGPNGLTASLNTDTDSAILNVIAPQADDGGWHNFALTFSGETGDIVAYVDGVETLRQSGFEGQIQAGAGVSGRGFFIGNGFATEQFPGLLDNIMMVRGVVDVAELGSLSSFRASAAANVATESPDNLPPVEEPAVEIG
ncbi:MAG: right-handed parallel beta-helix repeat-containing protein, partial [Amphiplicatus sp.]